MPKVPKPVVVKDPQWLQVVREMPCINSGSPMCNRHDTMSHSHSEASHLDGKSRDDRVLPMCGGCHRTSRYSWHNGQESYCRYFVTTKAELIAEAEALYRSYREGQ